MNALRWPLFTALLLANVAIGAAVPEGPAQITLSALTGVAILALIVDYLRRGRQGR